MSKAKQHLRKLLEAPAATRTAQVAEVYQEVQQLKTKGHTYPWIAEQLQKNGIDVTGNQLLLIMWKLRRKAQAGNLPASSPTPPNRPAVAASSGKFQYDPKADAKELL
jgi:G:T/U-mismatch repair DNA glycosylase